MLAHSHAACMLAIYAAEEPVGWSRVAYADDDGERRKMALDAADAIKELAPSTSRTDEASVAEIMTAHQAWYHAQRHRELGRYGYTARAVKWLSNN
jgi:hypothetical protein